MAAKPSKIQQPTQQRVSCAGCLVCPPSNLQPVQHPCRPQSAGASPHSLRLARLPRSDWPRGSQPANPSTRYFGAVSASGRNQAAQWGLAPSSVARHGQYFITIAAFLARAASLLPPRDPTRPSAPLLRLSLHRRRNLAVQQNTPCKHKSWLSRPLGDGVSSSPPCHFFPLLNKALWCFFFFFFLVAAVASTYTRRRTPSRDITRLITQNT